MRKEFFNLETFDTIEATQAALDHWVIGYNTEREHQSIGDVPPIKRFELATTPRARPSKSSTARWPKHPRHRGHGESDGWSTPGAGSVCSPSAITSVAI